MSKKIQKKKPEEKVDDNEQSLKPYRHIECPIFSGKKEDFKEWSERADVWLWKVKSLDDCPGLTLMCALRGDAWELVTSLKKEEIAKENGHELIMKVLNKRYGIDETQLRLDNMDKLFKIERGKDEDVQEFISRYDSATRTCEKWGMQALSEEYKGGYLLHRSNLDRYEEKIVRGNLKKDFSYDNVCEQLKAVLTNNKERKDRPESNWLEKREEITCYSCSDKGHMARQCAKQRSVKKCEGCFKKGHETKDCRFKNAICNKCKKKGHLYFHCQEKEETEEEKEKIFLGWNKGG